MTQRPALFSFGIAFAFAVLPACSSKSSNSQHAAITANDSGASDKDTEDTRPCGANTLVAGTFDFPLNGVAYSYIVHVPPGYDGSKRTPLVLNWHGLTSNATEQEIFSGMDKEADGLVDAGPASGQFIVVYPNSPDVSWNAGTCCEGKDKTRDDVGFARALVAHIADQTCVDSKRIYSTGMSNGAFMSYRLGCEAADLFAAIAPVAGKIGIPDCHPSRPVPLLAFDGTSDKLVSYDGGGLSPDGKTDVPENVQDWATLDGCTDDTPAVTYQKGTVTCQTWSHCKAGVTTTLCTAVKEGHCWPGTAYCPFGAFTTDIDASQQIAAFFSKFKLP